MRGRTARLVALLTALLIALFAIPQPTAAALHTVPHVATYSYDIHDRAAVPTITTTERGPPAVGHDHTSRPSADDRGSRGASARSQPGLIWTYPTYDRATLSVQVDSGRARTRSAAEARRGDLRSVSGPSVAAETEGGTQTLFHYTTEEGQKGILDSGQLNPSLKSVNPSDARYGNGQYLTDITPGSKTGPQLSRALLGNPFQASRFTHYLEIDVSGLDVVPGRPGVFVVPNEGPLDIIGRIIGYGTN